MQRATQFGQPLAAVFNASADERGQCRVEPQQSRPQFVRLPIGLVAFQSLPRAIEPLGAHQVRGKVAIAVTDDSPN